MIILDLVLKGNWYDLIKSGQKKFEYREVKSYWTKRLFSKPYTHIRFRRGYTKTTMLFELAGIEKTTDENDLGLHEVYKIGIGQEIGGDNVNR